MRTLLHLALCWLPVPRWRYLRERRRACFWRRECLALERQMVRHCNFSARGGRN